MGVQQGPHSASIGQRTEDTGGYQFGKGFGDAFAAEMDYLYNPEKREQRAMDTWKMLTDMEPETRDMVLAQPEVQRKIQEEHSKALPAGFFKDPTKGGMWGPANRDICCCQCINKMIGSRSGAYPQ